MKKNRRKPKPPQTNEVSQNNRIHRHYNMLHVVVAVVYHVLHTTINHTYVHISLGEQFHMCYHVVVSVYTSCIISCWWCSWLCCTLLSCRRWCCCWMCYWCCWCCTWYFIAVPQVSSASYACKVPNICMRVCFLCRCHFICCTYKQTLIFYTY